MKTASVRIEEAQAEKLREISSQMPGSSVSSLVQSAVDLWLELEGSVYLEELKKDRQKIAPEKRQSVVFINAAS